MERRCGRQEGVYDDVRIGQIGQEGMVNSAIFFSKRAEQTLVVKFRERNAENLAHINNVIKEFLPDRDINLVDYRFSLAKLYDTSRIFRDSVMAGGIITLIIALIGLIGDEPPRERNCRTQNQRGNRT